jgi:hypothetical protein
VLDSQSSAVICRGGPQGPHYPNSTTDTCCFSCHSTPPADNHCAPGSDIQGMTNCTEGCLFEVRGDPLEHTELSQSMPEKVLALVRETDIVDGGHHFFSWHPHTHARTHAIHWRSMRRCRGLL